MSKYCDREPAHEQAAARAKEGMLYPEALEKACAVFRMLSEPTRMKVVLALMQGNMCVYHLAEVTDSTVSGVSHQLRLLKDNGVVKAERLGRNMEYSIADDHVRKIVDMAIKHLACGGEGV